LIYRRRLKYYLIKLCRLHDSPRALAGGFAWGTAVHFYPTCGFGPLFAVGAARLFRTNMMAATLAWAVTMPLFPLFFYFNMITGAFLNSSAGEELTMVSLDTLHAGLTAVLVVGKTFFLGAVVNTLIGVNAFWLAGYLVFKRYRKRVLNCIRSVKI